VAGGQKRVSLPLCIDLFCGLGGWAEGALAEGYEVVGFDIERHCYGDQKYPAQLVLQDVLTLHGSQFKDAALIVASPPCQAYSYMAMPWDRAKREIRWQRWMQTSKFSPGFTLNALFDSCFRIQQEASIATGRKIPMVVENVKGAQPWVGSARWHYGSFYLWGDVPALMPFSGARLKGRSNFHVFEKTGMPSPSWHGADHEVSVRRYVELTKNNGGVKQEGLSGPKWFNEGAASKSSRSNARKAASAQIAKIPFELARYIASVYKP